LLVDNQSDGENYSRGDALLVVDEWVGWWARLAEDKFLSTTYNLLLLVLPPPLRPRARRSVVPDKSVLGGEQVVGGTRC